MLIICFMCACVKRSFIACNHSINIGYIMEHNKALTRSSLFIQGKSNEKKQYYMLTGKPAKQCDELINYAFS